MVSLNHIFSPGLYYYPILSLLKKPVVYSVSAAIGDNDLLLNRDYFNSIDKILVNNQRDYQRLVKLELTNAMVIPPAVDTRKLHIHKLPFSHQLRLLMASAPWEEKPIEDKRSGSPFRSVSPDTVTSPYVIMEGKVG